MPCAHHRCGCAHTPTSDTPARQRVALILPALLAFALVATGAIVGLSRSGSPAAAQDSAPPSAPANADAQPARPALEADAPEGELRYGRAEPIAQPKGTVRVACYNVENLFDDHDDPKLTGGSDDKDMTKPLAHREAIAKAIRRINPDVVALQEVESEQALKWFRDQHLGGAGYEHIASVDSGDGRGIECSVLSKFPIKDVKVWPLLPLGGTHPQKWGNEENREAGQPILFRRSPLRVTVTIPAAEVAKRAGEAGIRFVKAPGALDITIFVCHQKSGGPGGYWREREAAKTVELVGEWMSAHPNQPVLIMGDMNTQPGSKPIETYLQAGLIDAFKDRKQNDPLTITHSSGRVIDFIFMNSAAASRIVAESRFVLAMPDRPKGADWRTTPPPKGYASDHRPIVIDLKVAP